MNKVAIKTYARIVAPIHLDIEVQMAEDAELCHNSDWSNGAFMDIINASTTNIADDVAKRFNMSVEELLADVACYHNNELNCYMKANPLF